MGQSPRHRREQRSRLIKYNSKTIRDSQTHHFINTKGFSVTHLNTMCWPNTVITGFNGASYTSDVGVFLKWWWIIFTCLSSALTSKLTEYRRTSASCRWTTIRSLKPSVWETKSSTGPRIWHVRHKYDPNTTNTSRQQDKHATGIICTGRVAVIIHLKIHIHAEFQFSAGYNHIWGSFLI